MNGENIAIRKIRDQNGLEPSDGKGFHEGLVWDDIILNASQLANGATSPDRVSIQGGLIGAGFAGGVTGAESLYGSRTVSAK